MFNNVIEAVIKSGEKQISENSQLTYKQKYEMTRKALENLLAWSTSGKRYKSMNPYMIIPIKTAMKVLTEIDNKKDYLDLPLDTAKYDSGEYPV